MEIGHKDRRGIFVAEKGKNVSAPEEMCFEGMAERLGGEPIARGRGQRVSPAVRPVSPGRPCRTGRTGRPAEAASASARTTG